MAVEMQWMSYWQCRLHNYVDNSIGIRELDEKGSTVVGNGVTGVDIQQSRVIVL